MTENRARRDELARRCLDVLDDLRKVVKCTLVFGAWLTGAVAEVVDSFRRCIRGRCGFSDGLGNSFGSTLDLGAGFASAVAEAIESLYFKKYN